MRRLETVMRSKMQVLITGCYRTGTEYVSLLLGNHPDLAVTMYTVSFMRFCYDRYNPVEEEINYSKLLFDAAQRIRIRWNKNLNVHEILDYCKKAEKVSYALLYDLMMSDLFLTDQVQSWAEKTQLVWTKIPAFLEIYPRGKAINVVRDPRSVLTSFKKITYAPEPAYLGAIFNCYDSMSSGLAYKEKFDASRFYLLKYEDILTSPEKTLIDLFNFLELSTEHDMLTQKGWKDARNKPWHHNSAFLPPDAPGNNFDKSASINRWMDNLSNWEIALCEAINGELFDSFGYKLSGISEDWPKFLKPLLSDKKLMRYLSRWAVEKKGVEEFPTNPLIPENWEENIKSP